MLVYMRSMRDSEIVLCRVGSGWWSSVKSWKIVSKCKDLLSRRRVCGVESVWMSVESGKLKSPVMKAMQMCGGGMCFLIVCNVLRMRCGGQSGGR